MSNVPVTDWVNDFDHTDPKWTENPFPIWEELRGKCPVVHTDRFLGVYLPTTYEAVKQIAYDTESFSSRRIIVRNVRPENIQPTPPINTDPPHHKPAKQAAAAAVHARRDEEARAARARDLQRADRRVHQRRHVRCRRAILQAYSGARDRAHAGHPGEGRRPVHQVDPRDPRARHHQRRDPDAGRAGYGRVFPSLHRSAPQESGRRSDLGPDPRQGAGRPAVIRPACAWDRCGCC